MKQIHNYTKNTI